MKPSNLYPLQLKLALWLKDSMTGSSGQVTKLSLLKRKCDGQWKGQQALCYSVSLAPCAPLTDTVSWIYPSPTSQLLCGIITQAITLTKGSHGLLAGVAAEPEAAGCSDLRRNSAPSSLVKRASASPTQSQLLPSPLILTHLWPQERRRVFACHFLL